MADLTVMLFLSGSLLIIIYYFVDFTRLAFERDSSSEHQACLRTNLQFAIYIQIFR
jgi:hypothetical protein